MSYQSFSVTFRPRSGVTDLQISKFMKYVRRRCEYYHVVTEKTGMDRHIHAALFMKKACTKGNVAIDMCRLDPDLDSDEKAVARRGVKIQYNRDWVQVYLDKDDETEVVSSNMPEWSFLESYWPPALDQKKAMAEKAVDKYYAKLEVLWLEHRGPGIEICKESVRDFLTDMMYSARKIRVMDRKKHLSVALCLTDYLNKATSSPELSFAPWEL